MHAISQTGPPRTRGRPSEHNISTYKNSDGRWMVDVKIRLPGQPRPTRVRRVSPVQTHRGAQRYERELRAAILGGTWQREPQPPSEPAPTLASWAGTFVVEHSKAKGLRPSTIREQEIAFRVHVVPVLGASTPIDTIRTPHFERLRRGLAAKGLAPKSINNVVGILSRAVGFYFERQGLAVPHFDSCRVKVSKSPPQFWEPDQYATLTRVAEELGPAELATVLLMGDCGLRTGEVIALEWTHLRWTPEAQIVVQRSHWRGHFGPPKGGRPRTVPMTDRVVAALHALPRSLAHPWVLVRESKHGRGHETHSSLACAIGRVERVAELGTKARGKLHRLRHCFVTRWLQLASLRARSWNWPDTLDSKPR
jgi:integrase